jgi:hypothetical protein
MRLEVCVPIPRDDAEKVAERLHAVAPLCRPAIGWHGAHMVMDLAHVMPIRSLDRGPGMDCLSLLVEVPRGRLLRHLLHTAWHRAACRLGLLRRWNAIRRRLRGA